MMRTINRAVNDLLWLHAAKSHWPGRAAARWILQINHLHSSWIRRDTRELFVGRPSNWLAGGGRGCGELLLLLFWLAEFVENIITFKRLARLPDNDADDDDNAAASSRATKLAGQQ